MEPTILEKGQMILVGFSFFGDPFRISEGWTEENEIGRLWQRFIAYLTDHRDRLKHVADDQVCYELHVYNEETMSKGIFEVFVGLQVEKLEDVPADLLAKMLPPAKYAVFTLKGKQITSDWPKIIQEWLLGSGYRQAHAYGFQMYDERFKGLENVEESTLDVYVPIEKKAP